MVALIASALRGDLSSGRSASDFPVIEDISDRLFDALERLAHGDPLRGRIFGPDKRLAVLVERVETRTVYLRTWLESFDCFVMVLDEKSLSESWIDRWLLKTFDKIAFVVIDADVVQLSAVRDFISQIKSLDQGVPVIALNYSDEVTVAEFDPALAWPVDVFLPIGCGLVGLRLGILSTIEYYNHAPSILAKGYPDIERDV